MSARPTIRAREGAVEPPGRGLRRVGGAGPLSDTTRVRTLCVFILAAFGSGVGLIVGFGQMLKIQMGIDLGGGQIRVTQQFLHRPQIAARLQHVGGEGMAQLVRMNMTRQRLLTAPLGQPQLHTAMADTPLSLADKQRRLVGTRQGATYREPFAQPALGNSRRSAITSVS